MAFHQLTGCSTSFVKLCHQVCFTQATQRSVLECWLYNQIRSGYKIRIFLECLRTKFYSRIYLATQIPGHGWKRDLCETVLLQFGAINWHGVYEPFFLRMWDTLIPFTSLFRSIADQPVWCWVWKSIATFSPSCSFLTPITTIYCHLNNVQTAPLSEERVVR